MSLSVCLKPCYILHPHMFEGIFLYWILIILVHWTKFSKMKFNGISVPSKELWDLADTGIRQCNRITLSSSGSRQEHGWTRGGHGHRPSQWAAIVLIVLPDRPFLSLSPLGPMWCWLHAHFVCGSFLTLVPRLTAFAGRKAKVTVEDSNRIICEESS